MCKSYLFGIFFISRDMTGKNLTFVYDDYRTVLKGDWHKGNMVRAKWARIKKYR